MPTTIICNNLQTTKAELTYVINLSKNKCLKRLGDKLNKPTTSSKT